MAVALRLLIGIRNARVVGAFALALAATAPATAGAATTCSYDSGAEVLNVTMSADNDGAMLAVGAGDAIQVRGGGPVLVCAGGDPTFANTGDVNVFDNSGSGNTSVSIIDAAEFADDVGILLVMGGGGGDALQLGGSSGADFFRLGVQGVDTDADGDTDVGFVSGPEQILVTVGSGADTVDAQGSAGTGAPLSAASLIILGETGNDTLRGGEAGDRLEGGDDNDTLRGFGGVDLLIDDFLNPGDDTLDGGPGTDKLSYLSAPNGVVVDLGRTTPQPTGRGIDAISQVENLDGTQFDDTLIGDEGPNDLGAQVGNDTVEGRGGNDVLSGSLGVDTITYAGAPASVAVSLEAGTATGGDGTDTIDGFENLIGSRFADTLTGSAAANAITALAGADTVQALGGADLVDVRDGEPDNASCGTGIDRAVSDRRSLDTIQPDCEQVDALAELSPLSPPPDTRLDFRLSGARKQKLLKQKAVVVKVRCPEEACTVVARVAGKTMTKRLSAGPAKTLKLRLSGKRREAIQGRLQAGEKPKLKVTAKATDAAGVVVRRTLVVTAKT